MGSTLSLLRANSFRSAARNRCQRALRQQRLAAPAAPCTVERVAARRWRLQRRGAVAVANKRGELHQMRDTPHRQLGAGRCQFGGGRRGLANWARGVRNSARGVTNWMRGVPNSEVGGGVGSIWCGVCSIWHGVYVPNLARGVPNLTRGLLNLKAGGWDLPHLAWSVSNMAAVQFGGGCFDCSAEEFILGVGFSRQGAYPIRHGVVSFLVWYVHIHRCEIRMYLGVWGV